MEKEACEDQSVCQVFIFFIAAFSVMGFWNCSSASSKQYNTHLSYSIIITGPQGERGANGLPGLPGNEGPVGQKGHAGEAGLIFLRFSAF